MYIKRKAKLQILGEHFSNFQVLSQNSYRFGLVIDMYSNVLYEELKVVYALSGSI